MKKIFPILSLVGSLLACEGREPNTLPIIDCIEEKNCPSQEWLDNFMVCWEDNVGTQEKFYGLVIDFVKDPIIDGNGNSHRGYAFSENAISIQSIKALPHEVFHVYFRRTFHTTTPDHAQGNGPWTDSTDVLIKTIKNKCLTWEEQYQEE